MCATLCITCAIGPSGEFFGEGTSFGGTSFGAAGLAGFFGISELAANASLAIAISPRTNATYASCVFRAFSLGSGVFTMSLARRAKHHDAEAAEEEDASFPLPTRDAPSPPSSHSTALFTPPLLPSPSSDHRRR
jgi:hypothetical protein